MGALTLMLCDRNLVPLATSDGPIVGVKRGRVILSELDQFTPHSVEVGADQRRALLAMAPFTVIRFDEQGLGTVGWAMIHDPSQQIIDTGDTITIAPPNITDQLAQYSTGMGAVYQDTLANIVTSLGNTIPTGEVATVFDTDHTTVIGYVEYLGTTLAIYGANGALAAIYPGSYTGVALLSATGAPLGFVTTTATGAGVSNIGGTVVGTYRPTNEVTGWSASMLNDGGNVASAAPVAWVAPYPALVTIAGNSVRKVALADPAHPPATYPYDGAAASAQQVTPLAGGARSDAALTWQSPNTLGNYVMGLADPGGVTQFFVRFGFYVRQTVATDATGPYGQWYIWEAGALTTSGTYRAGATFEVRVNYASGAAVVEYWVNGGRVYTSGLTPSFPLEPLVVHSINGSAIENAIIQRTVNATQQWWSVRFDQASPVEALLNLAKATGNHVWQGVDTSGVPNRTLVFGKGGADSGVRLVSANGGDVNAIAANPDLRLVESLTYKQESSKVVNTITPLGSSTGGSQVDIERCWRIVNDPTYPNYGKYGTAPATVFPEYDAQRYPIKRRKTRDGHFEYYVRATAAYAALGFEVRGKYTDPQFAYVDSTAANQELTARALYVATTAKLAWESQTHHTLTARVVGAFRAPRAGTKVAVDFRRIGSDTAGNFSVMNTQQQAALAAPFVTQWARNYDENGATHDDVTLSNLGVQPAGTNARSSSSSLRDLEAIKITPQHTTWHWTVPRSQNVDINHPHVTIVEIPAEVFRVTRVGIYCVFEAYQAQVTTAAANVIAGMPKHQHVIHVLGGGHAAPTADDKWMGALVSGTDIIPTLNNAAGIVNMSTDVAIPVGSVDLTPTSHVHAIVPLLNDVSTAPLAMIEIDSGDGNFVARSGSLVDIISNTVGPWATTFNIYDATAYFTAAVGKAARVRVTPLVPSGNTNTAGLGAFTVYVSVTADVGGLGTAVFKG